MKRKEITKKLVMILNRKNPLVTMVYLKTFQRFKGYACFLTETTLFKPKSPSRHKIRNSNSGGLRPSVLPLGPEGSSQ